MRGPRSRLDRLRPLGPGTLFAVVLLAATSLMLLRTNEPIACETAVPLKIAAVPAIAPAIREITKRDVDAGCADIRVLSMTAGEAASMIAAGGPDQPALWIPDSALWPQRANQLAASSGVETPSVRPGQTLVTSPLVVVTARAHAGRLGWPDRPVSWRELVSGSVTGLSTTIGDPLSTTEGLTTLTAVRGLLGGSGADPAVAGAMLQVGRDAVPSIGSAYERLGATADALAFTATEQSVVAHNRDGVQPPVVAVYPRDGTVALEYPLVRVVAPGEPPPVAAVTGIVEQALRRPDATATLLAAGFRGPDGKLDRAFDAGLGVSAVLPAQLPPPSAEQATEVLRTWNAITLDSRMLVVIDVSGSMDGAAGNGQSRIELARDAGLAALGLFPDSTSMGLWAFSTARSISNGARGTPAEDWIELVPLGPLSQRLGNRSRRDAIVAAARTLPNRTGGGTALNDTVLAAFREVRASYEPGKVNSVVLMTDGRNEGPDSIDTATLIKTMREEIDPATPVSIIAIGLGPDVDFDALRELTAATEGKAYLARDPADMRQVFLDALIQRQCRPHC